MKRLLFLLLLPVLAQAQLAPIGRTVIPCKLGTSCWVTTNGVTLTPSRVPYATTGGALTDDSGLTYDAATDTLSAGALTATSGGSATLGTELLTNASFTSDLSSWTPGANWAWYAGTAQHTAGSTATITQGVSVTSGSSYQVSFAIAGRTAGSISVALGAVALNASGVTTWTASNAGTGIVAGASGSVALTITPTADFDGSLDSVSIKLITASSPAITVADGGVTAIAVRGSAALDNTFVGDRAGRLNTTGTSNSGMGVNALYANTSGGSNSAMGVDALRSNTTGSNNSAMGANALRSNTTGGSNSVMGLNALRSNTGGDSNTASGKDAGYTSGAAPTATNAVTTGSNLTFVGYQSGLGSATQRSNSTAIGSGAYVDADNTVVLGNGSVTDVLMGSTAGAYANAAGLKSPTATHQLGGANSATPVAQTLQAQGSRGGTDVDAGGASLTIQPGAGTGTGTASSLIFKAPTPQTTGSSAQPLATVLTLKDSGSAGTSAPQALFASGSLSAPSLAFSAFPGVGFSVDGTGNMTGSIAAGKGFFLQQPGTTYTLAANSSGQLATFRLALGHTTVGSSGNIDVFLSRAAAATLQLGSVNSATPVAQTLQAQGSRGGTDVDVAGANLTIQSGSGTGAATGSSLVFKTATPTTSGSSAQSMDTRMSLSSATFVLYNGTTPRLEVSSNTAQAKMGSNYRLAWSSTSDATATGDTFIGRGAAATLQLGAADAAAPVAQTLQVQGSRGGTDTDVAGANLVIRSGAGTGSAAGSTVTIQTPAVGSSGTTAQTQTNRLIASAKGINIPGLAEYADNAAALAGGLVAGDLYRTSTGVLMVTY